jgi:hypothetical protein
LKIDSLIFRDSRWKIEKNSILEKEKASIIFSFGTVQGIESCDFSELQKMYPNAHLVGGSTAGTIYKDEIFEDSFVVASVLQLEKSRVKIATEELSDMESSFKIGERIYKNLEDDELRHIVVLSDTININGSQFVSGLNSASGSKIPISGGILAEETKEFLQASVIVDDSIKSFRAVGVGFYGEIDSYFGSDSGWEDFGTYRTVTKSDGNVVYEIDEKPALDLYKKYLGDLAKDLPVSGLRFPLNVLAKGEKRAVIRTLSAINEKEKSLTFVGDVPQDSKARLMKTNIDGLIDGAESAIKMTNFISQDREAYCLAISCIGRRVILDQLTEEELTTIKEYLGEKTEITGFYSYGEIAPFSDSFHCHFHNQTMTLTLLQER